MFNSLFCFSEDYLEYCIRQQRLYKVLTDMLFTAKSPIIVLKTYERSMVAVDKMELNS